MKLKYVKLHNQSTPYCLHCVLVSLELSPDHRFFLVANTKNAPMRTFFATKKSFRQTQCEKKLICKQNLRAFKKKKTIFCESQNKMQANLHFHRKLYLIGLLERRARKKKECKNSRKTEEDRLPFFFLEKEASK